MPSVVQLIPAINSYLKTVKCTLGDMTNLKNRLPLSSFRLQCIYGFLRIWIDGLLYTVHLLLSGLIFYLIFRINQPAKKLFFLQDREDSMGIWSTNGISSQHMHETDSVIRQERIRSCCDQPNPYASHLTTVNPLGS